MSRSPFADFQNEVYLNGLLGVQPPLPFGWRDVRDTAYAVMTPQAVGLRRGLGRGGGHRAGQPAGLRPLAAGPAHAARHHRPGATTARPCSARRCPRRCCWRRSGCCRSCTRTPRAPSPARRRGSGVPMVVSTASSTTLEEVAAAGDRARSGTSSTGRTTASSPRRSCAARRRPATRRSSSRSTPGSWAGGRATSTRRTCRSCAARASPTTSATRCSGRACRRATTRRRC